MYRSRYRRIVLFFARILLSFAWWDLILPRFGLRGWAQRTRSARLQRSAVAFRGLAVNMGGVLIKVGQFLSTRVDVLPIEVTSILAGLQDEVPPVPFPEIRALAEAEFGEPLVTRYTYFSPEPLAAASLGQVHRARIQQAGGLLDVVVKIQRPHIQELVTTDLSALHTVGRWLQRYKPISRRADVPALLDEFTRILYQELDYLAEGRNAETFAANFRQTPGVHVPSPIWTHTTQCVLTLEDVWAIKITDYEAIEAAGISRVEVASRLVDTYLKQIFEDGFFHADPHPGNLFVDPVKGADGAPTPWKLVFVDFGMVGHVPANVRAGLREMIIGVATRNSSQVVHSYTTLGMLLPGADLELLEKAEAKIFDRYWGKSMDELRNISTAEIREFLSEFRDLLYTLPFQVPHDMIFLGRAVAILSGICTGLDPNFNIWAHVAPYAQKLLAEEIRPSADHLLEEVGSLVRSLVSVPRKMDQILSRLERGDVAVKAPEVSRQVSRLEGAVRQVAGALIFTGLLLGGIQLYLGGSQLFGQILMGLSGLSLLWVIAAGRR